MHKHYKTNLSKKERKTLDGDLTARNLLDDLEMQSHNLTPEQYCELIVKKLIHNAVQ